MMLGCLRLNMDNKPTEREIGNFFKGMNCSNPEACWIWNGYKQASGHGQFRYRSKTIVAYRFSYMLKYPDFDQSLCVLHKCDNGACINPTHMFLGTMTDNMADKVAKGRQSKGLSNTGWLLETEVEEIKKLYQTGKYTQQELGRRFKVNASQISKIINGHRWGHLTT